VIVAKDYSPLQTKAQNLIEKFGRTVVLVKESRTATDATKPWLGTSTSDTEVSASAVYVPLAGEQPVTVSEMLETAGLSRRADAFLVGAISGQDVRTFQKVQDGSRVWRITNVSVIQPGDTVLLYQVEVAG